MAQWVNYSKYTILLIWVLWMPVCDLKMLQGWFYIISPFLVAFLWQRQQRFFSMSASIMAYCGNCPFRAIILLTHTYTPAIHASVSHKLLQCRENWTGMCIRCNNWRDGSKNWIICPNCQADSERIKAIIMHPLRQNNQYRSNELPALMQVLNIYRKNSPWHW